MKKTLVVLAAGMGSRFGGLKQIEPVGPNGEFIIDYSIYDAIRSGFEKVVFIIKEENKEIFDKTIVNRIKNHIDICYAFQKNSDIPQGFKEPIREKPLGTAHALYCARNLIDGNFAIINADDFYGYEAFQKISQFLDKDLVSKQEKYGLVAYKAINTITDSGSVKRGICEISNGKLVKLDESKMELLDNKLFKTSFKTGKMEEIDKDTLVSMNLLGFPREFLNHIEEEFTTFLRENKDNLATSEYLMPDVLTSQIVKGKAEVEIIETKEKWFGITYREDKEKVVAAIKDMVDKGIYKNNLWS